MGHGTYDMEHGAWDMGHTTWSCSLPRSPAHAHANYLLFSTPQKMTINQTITCKDRHTGATTMSNMNEILSTLTAANEALEREPTLRAELLTAQGLIVERNKTVDDLIEELNLYREETASLEAKLKEAVAERDAAIFQQHQADDNSNHALELVRRMVTMGEAHIAQHMYPSEIVTPVPHFTTIPAEIDTAQQVMSHESTMSPEPSPEQAKTNTPTTEQVDTDWPVVEKVLLSYLDGADPVPALTEPNSEQDKTNTPTTEQIYAGWPIWKKPIGVTWLEFVDAGGTEPSWNYDPQDANRY